MLVICEARYIALLTELTEKGKELITINIRSLTGRTE